MQPEVERRSFVAEMRASDEGRSISGYAALFNVKSQVLWDFREVIMPGAFDRALREGHDVRALWNHNPDLVLGRTKSGTLKLAIDEKGLKIDADLPDTNAGRDAYTLIKRGDVSQMSFAFRTLTDDWRTENGETIRELKDLELLDVSPVAYPAYEETQVSARAKEAVELLKAPAKAGLAVTLDMLKARQRQAEAL